MIGLNWLPNYGEEVAMILFGIGFANLLFQKNLIKKIIGFNIMDTAIFLFLAEKGYIAGRVAPIIVDGEQIVEKYINPVPGGLVLTGIVVSVSFSALMLALTVRLYKKYRTLNLDEIYEKNPNVKIMLLEPFVVKACAIGFILLVISPAVTIPLPPVFPASIQSFAS
mgnify:CR=1 FL=1